MNVKKVNMHICETHECSSMHVCRVSVVLLLYACMSGDNATVGINRKRKGREPEGGSGGEIERDSLRVSVNIWSFDLTSRLLASSMIPTKRVWSTTMDRLQRGKRRALTPSDMPPCSSFCFQVCKNP